MIWLCAFLYVSGVLSTALAITPDDANWKRRSALKTILFVALWPAAVPASLFYAFVIEGRR